MVSNRRNFISGLAGGIAAFGISEKAAAAARTAVPGKLLEIAEEGSASNAGQLADLGPSGIAKRFWIDERIASLPAGRWRKIWLDFHNSQYIPKIGRAHV